MLERAVECRRRKYNSWVDVQERPREKEPSLAAHKRLHNSAGNVLQRRALIVSSLRRYPRSVFGLACAGSQRDLAGITSACAFGVHAQRSAKADLQFSSWHHCSQTLPERLRRAQVQDGPRRSPLRTSAFGKHLPSSTSHKLLLCTLLQSK